MKLLNSATRLHTIVVLDRAKRHFDKALDRYWAAIVTGRPVLLLCLSAPKPCAALANYRASHLVCNWTFVVKRFVEERSLFQRNNYTPANKIDLVLCPWEARADEGVARDFVLTDVPLAFKVPRRRSDATAIKGELRLYCADVNPRWR